MFEGPWITVSGETGGRKDAICGLMARNPRYASGLTEKQRMCLRVMISLFFSLFFVFVIMLYLELAVVRNYRSKLKQHFFLLFGLFFALFQK